MDSTDWLRSYIYVDAYWTQADGRPHKWVRCQLANLEKFVVEPAGAQNVFCSVQRFREATRGELAEHAHAGEEVAKRNGHDLVAETRARWLAEADDAPDKPLHYCGLFFDFDAPASARDRDPGDYLAPVQKEAHELASWFLDAFGLGQPMVQVWFSGSKGFHVLVRPEPFGIRPNRHLTYIIRNLAADLKQQLKLEHLDMAVYTVPRQWRVANTIHPRSGRYKIELSVRELAEKSPAEIYERARSPRTGASW